MSDLNSLLRFLSQDAKLPLSTAIKIAKPLQTASLGSPQQISSSNLTTLIPLFPSADDAKKAFNAAKRINKRSATNGTGPPISKKRKLSPTREPDPEQEAVDLETSLALPSPNVDEDVLAPCVLWTNRAPLMLVFTLVLLEYTMPRQPLSSRLSIAQAIVSEGARAKARHLGLEKDAGAEQEGWGSGQPTIRVMSRDVSVIRRVGYPLADIRINKPSIIQQAGLIKNEEAYEETDSQSTVGSHPVSIKAEQDDSENLPKGWTDEDENRSNQEEQVAFWALDLEALKKSGSNIASNTVKTNTNGLPIYSPHSARAYIMKAFASEQTTPPEDTDSKKTSNVPKTKKVKRQTSEKEENLGLLLGALQLLFNSWEMLDANEMGRRAWSWYVMVRPDVEQGPAGWGGKGAVRLQRILDLRRRED